MTVSPVTLVIDAFSHPFCAVQGTQHWGLPGIAQAFICIIHEIELHKLGFKKYPVRGFLQCLVIL